jgi:predicted RNA-binding protein with PIN domain
MSFDVEPAIWWEVDQQLDDGKVQTWLQRAETADKAIERIADEIHRRGDKVAVILAVRRDR